jgi:hypothetical protein
MGTDLKTIDAVNRQIDALTEIGRQIRECGDIGEIKKHKDTMEQLRLLAKRLGAGIPVLNAAWKETMKSRRALGRMLIDMKERGELDRGGGERKRPVLRDRSHGGSGGVNLGKLGLSDNESSRSQYLALIPDELLWESVERAEKEGRELITRAFVELGIWVKRQQEEEEIPDPEPEPEPDPEPEPEATTADDQGQPDASPSAEGNGQAEASGDAPGDKAPSLRGGEHPWEPILRGYCRIVDSIGDMGGVDVLARGWKGAPIGQLAGTFDMMINRLTAIRDELRRIANERL